jgi:hypothetical protein
MDAYREVERLSIPPAVAARRLADSLGDPVTSPTPEDTTSDHSHWRWCYSRPGGLYSYDVRLEPTAGDVTTTVLGRTGRTVGRRTTAVGYWPYAGSIGCIWAALIVVIVTVYRLDRVPSCGRVGNGPQ